MKFLEVAKNIFILPPRRQLDLPIKPKFINFLITYQCNSRCIMCGIWKTYRGKGGKQKLETELTKSEILSFFRKNKDFLSELSHIGFTGGEVTMRQDMVEIIRGIKKILPKVEMGFQTNGLLPKKVEKMLKEIISFYPDFSLAVSLDGLKKTHEETRGIKGSFERSLETIRLAKALGIKRITCGMTLNEDNYKQMEEVRALSEDLGVEFTCSLPDKAGYFNNIDYDFDFKKPTLKKIIKLLQKNFPGHYFVDNLKLQMEGKRKRRLPCYSGFTSIVLDPYGNVKPCILLNDSFGNIKKEKSLEKLLYNEETKPLREKIRNCSCWNQCEVSTSAVVSYWDVIWWFLFYCKERKVFAKQVFNRLSETKSV